MNKVGGMKVGLGKNGKFMFFNPLGHIDATFNKVLMSYGSGWTMKQLNESVHTSGGHAQMRAVADVSQTEMINRIMTHVLQS